MDSGLRTMSARTAENRQWACVNCANRPGGVGGGELLERGVGAKHRERKPSDSGNQALPPQVVCEAHVAQIKADLPAELFSYDIDAGAPALAEMMDDKLPRGTNVKALSPSDVIARYKSLAGSRA